VKAIYSRWSVLSNFLGPVATKLLTGSKNIGVGARIWRI